MVTYDTYQRTIADGDNLADGYFNAVAVQIPIGSIIAWHKTFVTRDSGTTTSTTANKLVDSTQNFLSTVSVDQIVFNSTDGTFAFVTAVDSNTTLSLSSDIMVSGEAYTIYATPRLPDMWVECNGQVISDAASPFNGGTAPDLNGTTDATSRFIRGLKNAVTGTTGGSDTQVFQWSNGYTDQSRPATTQGGATILNDVSTWQSNGTTASTLKSVNGGYTNSKTVLPPYVNMTWIIRIK